jgi:GNAT superfamily N-acetyltransferase
MIQYQTEPGLGVEEFTALLARTSLGERRPLHDVARMERMLREADILLTARDEGRLVGVARALTDHAYCTYLSDLAVDEDWQRRGIGRELLRRTHEEAGLQTSLILIAAPAARDYYPHIGMAAHDSCWMIRGAS